MSFLYLMSSIAIAASSASSAALINMATKTDSRPIMNSTVYSDLYHLYQEDFVNKTGKPAEDFNIYYLSDVYSYYDSGDYGRLLAIVPAGGDMVLYTYNKTKDVEEAGWKFELGTSTIDVTFGYASGTEDSDYEYTKATGKATLISSYGHESSSFNWFGKWVLKDDGFQTLYDSTPINNGVMRFKVDEYCFSTYGVKVSDKICNVDQQDKSPYKEGIELLKKQGVSIEIIGDEVWGFIYDITNFKVTGSNEIAWFVSETEGHSYNGIEFGALTCDYVQIRSKNVRTSYLAQDYTYWMEFFNIYAELNEGLGLSQIPIVHPKIFENDPNVYRNNVGFNNIRELSYCFFDFGDSQINGETYERMVEKISRIDYSFTKLTYEYRSRQIKSTWIPAGDVTGCYLGLYNDDPSVQGTSDEQFNKLSEVRFDGTVNADEYVEGEINQGTFFFKTYKTAWKAAKIVDCRGETNLPKEGEDGYEDTAYNRAFITKNRYYTKDDGSQGQYSWAFLVDDDVRTAETYGYGSALAVTWWNTLSVCHEIRDVMISKATVQFDGIEGSYDLKVLDFPTSQDPTQDPFDDLVSGDVYTLTNLVVEDVVNFFQTVGITLAWVMGIILIVAIAFGVLYLVVFIKGLLK